ncbi:MAG: hypothetical protein P4N59_28605 [Negativicutes bacterium]|nr:hypothetical protein [Negativicutes bacterium]
MDAKVSGNSRKGLNDMLFRVIQLEPKELVIYIDTGDIAGAVLEAAKVFDVSTDKINNPDLYSIRPVGGEDLPLV